MQVQSNLGPAGSGPAPPVGGSTTAFSAQAPTASTLTSAATAPTTATATPNAPSNQAPPPAVQEPPPLPTERPAVAPRARLAYDSDRARMYVEVLDRSTGDVLFTVPAQEANDSIPGGLPQGSLVDQRV